MIECDHHDMSSLLLDDSLMNGRFAGHGSVVLTEFCVSQVRRRTQEILGRDRLRSMILALGKR
jgi:hypothetical protein